MQGLQCLWCWNQGDQVSELQYNHRKQNNNTAQVQACLTLNTAQLQNYKRLCSCPWLLYRMMYWSCHATRLDIIYNFTSVGLTGWMSQSTALLCLPAAGLDSNPGRKVSHLNAPQDEEGTTDTASWQDIMQYFAITTPTWIMIKKTIKQVTSKK